MYISSCVLHDQVRQSTQPRRLSPIQLNRRAFSFHLPSHNNTTLLNHQLYPKHSNFLKHRYQYFGSLKHKGSKYKTQKRKISSDFFFAIEIIFLCWHEKSRESNKKYIHIHRQNIILLLLIYTNASSNSSLSLLASLASRISL